MHKQFRSLAEAFLDYFDVDLVTTANQLQQTGHIRYQVYCAERGFENPAAFPDRRETDEFDAHSLHCLISHRRSSRPAGCVRLVCASDADQLPLEKHCISSLSPEYTEMLRRKRDGLCEFSRLAVDAAFRKRSSGNHPQNEKLEVMDLSQLEKRSFSMVGIGSFLAAFALARLSDRTHIFHAGSGRSISSG